MVGSFLLNGNVFNSYKLVWGVVVGIKKCKRKIGLEMVLKVVFVLIVYYVWVIRNVKVFGG